MVRNFTDIAKSLEVAELRAEIASKRNKGVILEIKEFTLEGSIDSNNLTAILNSFVTQLGYSALDNRWKEITQEEAYKILIFVLNKDLAYSVELMSLEEAEEFANKVFNFFTGGCKFFTNALFVDNYSALGTWDSLTKATFDTGVVILGDRQIGIVWVKDED